MALDWSKLTYDDKGNVTGYGGQSLGGTYGSWWDSGKAQTGATTPWGTAIGDLGFGGGANKSQYDKFLNLQGGTALPENIRFDGNTMETYSGDPNTGWVQGGTDGDIAQYQNKLELNSGFHRYPGMFNIGGDEQNSQAWKQLYPYLRGEDLLDYNPEWGVVAKDSKSQERIDALSKVIKGSYAGPEQRAALRKSLMSMGAMGLGAWANASGGFGNLFGGPSDALSGAGSDLGNLASDGWGGGFDFNVGNDFSSALNLSDGGYSFLDGSGDSIFGKLTSGSDSIFGGNSSIFGGAGGGAGGTMAGVDTGGFWDKLFTPENILRGGTSLLSGFMGSNAADKATEAQRAASELAIAEQRRQYNQSKELNKPFYDTGVSGNLRLRQLLGLDPMYLQQDSGSLLRPFEERDLANDVPYQTGMQFGLDEGRRGIDARALAGGMYDSGATLKALTRFGNDYGNTKANEAYNRYNQDNANIYNRLAGISGSAQTAAAQVGAQGANSANNIANSIEGMGNASAAGVVGSNNAWANALGGLGNIGSSAQENEILKKILASRGYKV